MKNIIKYLSKGNIKSEFQSVYLTGDKAVATDSFKLIEITRDQEVSEPVIVKIPKGVRKIDNITPDGTIESGISKIQGEIIDGNFPDYKQVIPTGEPVYQITLSPEHLAVIVESYKKEKSITLNCYGNEKPVKINEGGILTLLMPIITR
jgi:DNA polymerase III sliding clamp (beta) subunit (PCNA family)